MSVRRSHLAVAVAVVLALLALAAGTAFSLTARAQITVYAAASLTNVFPAIDSREQYSFGGSNALAAQITQGAPADVFASADMALPKSLHEKGLCSKPVVFARNKVVIVVPKANPTHIRSIHDLTRPGVKIDIAAAGVPVGDYTLQILKRLGLTNAVLENVVSRETDVREVLTKIALGEADAGFVYSTDAKTVSGKVLVVKVPARAQPKLQYGVCAVSHSAHRSAAEAFIKRVLSKAGQRKLHRFGFLARAEK